MLQTSEDLEQAFLEFNTPIYRYIYARVQDQGIAEDIVQEVFLRAWQHKETFDEEKSSLKNWLFVIGTNILRDYFRKNKIEIESEDAIDKNITNEKDLAVEMEKKDLKEFVFEKISSLTVREQEMLTLRYVNDLSVKEIAEILDIEYSAAKVAFHRSIKKLQHLCKDYEKI